MRTIQLLVTCEHGGNRVPPAYAEYFADQAEALASHRGYDAGALTCARDFAAAFEAPLVASTTSRLVADLNRSERHPRVHGPTLRTAERALRRDILQRYHVPYRTRVQHAVQAALDAGHLVLHLSCHSFTPVWEGEERRCDVGLLFDPRRPLEQRFCLAWQRALRGADATLIVRRNYPYRGTSDGLTSALRGMFDGDRYVGVELEVNQRYPLAGGARWKALRMQLVSSFRAAVSALEGGTRRNHALRSAASWQLS